MNRVMQEKSGGHLTDQMLRALALGKLSVDEKIRALDHIAICDECSARLADSYDSMTLLKLPPQFGEEVRASLRRRIETAPNRSRVEPQTGRPAQAGRGRKERQTEYRKYSVNVVIAACFTLLVLFSGSFTTGMGALTESKMFNPDFSHMDQLSQQLSDFSDHLLNWEGN